jgi:hypothetical protein
MTRLQADRDEVISSIVSSLALESLRVPIRSDVRFWRRADLYDGMRLVGS